MIYFTLLAKSRFLAFYFVNDATLFLHVDYNTIMYKYKLRIHILDFETNQRYLFRHRLDIEIYEYYVFEYRIRFITRSFDLSISTVACNNNQRLLGY